MITSELIKIIRKIIRWEHDFSFLVNKDRKSNSHNFYPIKESIQNINNKNPQYLSGSEIKFLTKKAEIYENENNYKQALGCYKEIINKSEPNSLFYKQRAHIYSRLLDFEMSIKDIRNAIEIDGDNSDFHFLLGGYLLSNALSTNGKIIGIENKSKLEEVVNCYRVSLEKEPTNECAWINLIEINILSNNWDDAISNFGSCKSYIKSQELKLIRSFLGCLAIILSGDIIDDVDLIILEMDSVRLTNNIYRVCEIETLIDELEKSGFDSKRIEKGKIIYKLFIKHYDEEPIRYRFETGSGKKIDL